MFDYITKQYPIDVRLVSIGGRVMQIRGESHLLYFFIHLRVFGDALESFRVLSCFLVFVVNPYTYLADIGNVP